MSNFNAEMDSILASNNISFEKDFALLQAQCAVVILQSSTTGIASAIMPEGMALVSSEDDVEAAIKRVISDEAFTVANLRAMAKYLEAKFEDKAYDASEIAKFYELYKTSSDADKESAQIGTLRLIGNLVDTEFNRVMDDSMQTVVGADFDKIAKEFEGQGVVGVYVNLQPAIEFAINLAQVIHKAEQIGMSTEQARDANRAVGMINMVQLKAAMNSVGSRVTEEVFKNLLPKDQFELVEAMADREVHRIQSGSEHSFH